MNCGAHHKADVGVDDGVVLAFGVGQTGLARVQPHLALHSGDVPRQGAGGQPGSRLLITNTDSNLETECIELNPHTTTDRH